MRTRRFSTWPRGGLHVRGRKKRVKLCLATKANALKKSFKKRLGELQGIVPGCQGMELHALFQSTEKYIILLEAKVTILRCLSTLYGV